MINRAKRTRLGRAKQVMDRAKNFDPINAMHKRYLTRLALTLSSKAEMDKYKEDLKSVLKILEEQWEKLNRLPTPFFNPPIDSVFLKFHANRIKAPFHEIVIDNRT